MTNKHQYQIKLRPLAKYFFGGERYYDNEDGVFYFERSREYPQQTSVLGMLRYQLLLESGLMEQTNRGARIRDAAPAAALIGEKSFDGFTTKSFGKISCLSPVVIVDGQGKFWTNYPKARVEDEEEHDGFRLEELELNFHQGGKIHLGHSLQTDIPVWTNYNHKKELEHGLLHIPSGDYLKYSEVFSEKVQEEAQIGIYKPYRKNGVVEETEDRGFYKYQYGQLNKGYAFACFVGADEPLPLRNTIVRFGKERVPFELTVTEVANPFQNANIEPGSRILLVSDAYLDGDWGQYCKAAVADLIPFKNLQYQLSNTDNYDEEPPRSAKRLNLLKRGSLLWVSDQQSDAKALQEMFNNEIVFKTIGYNHYEVIKKP